MEWLLDIAPTSHTITLGTAVQEAALLTAHIGATSAPVRFRVDRVFHTLFLQEMQEGFCVETPYPLRRWEWEPTTSTFVCEVRIEGQYRTLYGQMLPAILKTVLQNAVHRAGPTTVLSPMTGVVLRVEVACGEVVAQGRVLAVLDAMKMENQILNKQLGTIEKIHVSPGENVQKGTPLFTFLSI